MAILCAHFKRLPDGLIFYLNITIFCFDRKYTYTVYIYVCIPYPDNGPTWVAMLAPSFKFNIQLFTPGVSVQTVTGVAFKTILNKCIHPKLLTESNKTPTVKNNWARRRNKNPAKKVHRMHIIQVLPRCSLIASLAFPSAAPCTPVEFPI
jgi:hypothetical protein